MFGKTKKILAVIIAVLMLISSMPIMSAAVADTLTLYVKNDADWDTVYAHYWKDGGDTTEWPGVAMTHVSGNLYKVVVGGSYDWIIFSDNGANQTADKVIPGDNYVYSVAEETWTWYADPIETTVATADETEAVEDTTAETVPDDITDLPEQPEGTYRYFFYMPDKQWVEDNNYTATAGIYWWEGTDACYSLPGYEANKADAYGVYYYDVPTDVTTIIWNNYVDGGTDAESEIYVSDYRTRTIGTEYYDIGESAYYPDGVENFNNMIYVLDPSLTEVSEATGKSTFYGEWFYYYGNGEYGTAKSKEDAQTVYTQDNIDLSALLPSVQDTTASDADYVPNGLGYSIEDGKVKIIGYYGDATELIIPATIEGYPVNTISIGAFNTHNSLEKITIPESITDIGYHAFAGASLTEINVSGSNINYTSIDGVLFNKDATVLIQYPCGREDTSYTVPESVVYIEDLAFDNCLYLANIRIPDGVTAFGFGAFSNNLSLTSISIPASVTDIGDSAFFGCSNLTDVYYGGTEALWNEISIDIDNEHLTLATIHFGNTDSTDDEAEPIIVYFENSVGWDEVYAYVWGGESGEALGQWPGALCVELNYDLWEVIIPADCTNIIFNDGNNLQTQDMTNPGKSMVAKFAEQPYENFYNFMWSSDGTGTDKPGSSSTDSTDATDIAPTTDPTEATVAPETDPTEPTTVVPDSVATEPSEATEDEPDGTTAPTEYATEPATQVPSHGCTMDTIPPTGSGYEVGDANKDGKINIKDATTIQKYAAKMTELDDIALVLADFDKNSKVNVRDATAIQKKIAGLI